MTEYGRGPGPEPWHPEDPLYGDLGYAGQQAPEALHPYGDPQTGAGQSPYDAQAQYYQRQGQPRHQENLAPQSPQSPQEYDAWAGGRQQPDHGPGTGQYPPGGQHYPGQAGGPGFPGGSAFDPLDGGGRQVPQAGYPGQGGGYGGQDQAPGYDGRSQGPGYDGRNQGSGYGGQEQQYGGGWDTGQHGTTPFGAGPGDPYGQQQPRGHHPEEPDYYATQGPAHQDPPRSARPQQSAQPESAQRPAGPAARRTQPGPPSEPDPHIDWDPGPDQGEHAFFAGGDDDDDDDLDEPGGRGARRGRGGKGKKRRSGCACFVVALVLVGGVAGGGYAGYRFYQNHFGPPPDFTGDGTGQAVTVEVPQGAGGYTIGQLLKDKGVVKSVDAFVDAQKDNPKGQTIQDGVYTLRKRMSAASAVTLMLDPKSRNNLIIAEGWRNSVVYAQIDSRLHLKKGTTGDIAQKDWKKLGLPDWAMDHKNVKDPLEGFLYPSSYPVAKGMKPEDILKKMVAASTRKYESLDLETQADKLDLDGPWQVITVASLVQAEGKTHDDFRKMSEVVYNRLKPTNTQTNQLLQFDSTFNYLKKQSKIDISESEINSNRDPYNTYTQKGLTPGPIGNPGAEALAAALNPTHDGWFYFVATDGMNKTEFAKTYAEFQRLKEKFNGSGS